MAFFLKECCWVTSLYHGAWVVVATYLTVDMLIMVALVLVLAKPENFYLREGTILNPSTHRHISGSNHTIPYPCDQKNYDLLKDTEPSETDYSHVPMSQDTIIIYIAVCAYFFLIDFTLLHGVDKSEKTVVTTAIVMHALRTPFHIFSMVVLLQCKLYRAGDMVLLFTCGLIVMNLYCIYILLSYVKTGVLEHKRTIRRSEVIELESNLES